MKSRVILFVLALVTLAPALDCGGGEANQPLQPARRLGYFLDRANDAVYVIESVDTAEGDVTPVATISGEDTQITNATSLVVDGRRDILYVADIDAQLILVFAPASTLDGNVAPRRTLPTTNIDGTEGNVQHLELDEVNNRLYAYNASQQAVQVWDDVSGANGVGPDRSFFINFFASAMLIDTQRDLGYFSDFIDRQILVYNQPSTLIGNPLPAAIWENATEPFNNVPGITANIPNDLAFVANAQRRDIQIYENASTLPNAENNNGSENTNDVIPERTLVGDNTQITTDMSQILFLENILYVLISRTQVALWDSANTVDGDTAPNRVMTIVPETTEAATLVLGDIKAGVASPTTTAVELVDFSVDLLH